MDWSPELWITRFDSDEQNAWLAQHVWDENALDVPEDFFDFSLDFLRTFYRNPFLALVAFALEDLCLLVLERGGLVS